MRELFVFIHSLVRRGRGHIHRVKQWLRCDFCWVSQCELGRCVRCSHVLDYQERRLLSGGDEQTQDNVSSGAGSVSLFHSIGDSSSFQCIPQGAHLIVTVAKRHLVAELQPCRTWIRTSAGQWIWKGHSSETLDPDVILWCTPFSLFVQWQRFSEESTSASIIRVPIRVQKNPRETSPLFLLL